MSDLSPQASPLASSGWRSPRRRLAWGLLALTLAIASSFFLLAMRELGETARREAQARAQVVADDLASQVERAVTLGIPLDKLEGVEDLFAQRVQNLAEIRSIT